MNAEKIAKALLAMCTFTDGDGNFYGNEARDLWHYLFSEKYPDISWKSVNEQIHVQMKTTNINHISTVGELIEYLKLFPETAEMVVTYDSGYGNAYFLKSCFSMDEEGKLHIEVS